MAQKNEALTPVALDAIRENKPLRLRLSYELNITTHTVDRWVKKNDAKLSQHKAVRIISEVTKLPEEQILQVA